MPPLFHQVFVEPDMEKVLQHLLAVNLNHTVNGILEVFLSDIKQVSDKPLISVLVPADTSCIRMCPLPLHNGANPCLYQVGMLPEIGKSLLIILERTCHTAEPF